MTTPTYTQEELVSRYEKLPQALKDAIFSQVNAEKMYALGKRNGLTIDQMGGVTSETGYVILGITHPRDFVRNLKQKLNIDQEKVRQVAEDVNREIFRPIREHLKDLYKIADLEISGVSSETEKVIIYPKVPPLPPPPPPNIPIREEPPRPEFLTQTRFTPSATEEEKKLESKGRAPMVFPQKIEEVHKETMEEIELSHKDRGEGPEKEEPFEESIYKGQDPYREPIE